MKNNIKVSAVMSALNAEKYVGQAIESILNQTFKDFELIIFEDGSKDRTKKIIQDYAQKDKRIVAIYNETNIGYVGFINNLNKGVNIAKGEYIARMDADDISMPDRFQKQVNFLDKNPEISLLGTGAFNIDENGDKISKFNPKTNVEEISKKLPFENCFYHPSIMFRRENFVGYRNKFLYCEDYDMYLNLLSLGKKMTNLDEPLLCYRIHTNSVSQTSTVRQALIAEKAKDFYQMRVSKGFDDYDSFNPKEIMEMDIENNNSKLVLEKRILREFKVNNLLESRNLARKYKSLGFSNRKITLIYFLSFLNKEVLELIRKVVWRK